MGTIRELQSHYKSRLEEMKRLNDLVNQSLRSQRLLARDIDMCNTTYKNIKSLNESLQSKNLKYISDIVVIIEEAVAYSINSVLPFKQYKVQLDYVPYRNNGTLKLYFIDGEGRKLPPKTIEGDMLNQVLSFSSITHITYTMGYTTVFYDEAFSSANVRSLALINAIILYYNSLGVKFVFVSQSPVLYAGLERTMLELISDGKQVVDVQTKKVFPSQEEIDAVVQVTDLFDSITRIGE